MSVLHKLLPNRAGKKSVKIVADFDQLIAEPIGFRFQGRDFEIKPVDTETFMKTTHSLQEIQDLLKKKGEGQEITNEEVYEAYLKFTQPLCPQITLKILKSMSLSQIHALVNLIIRHILGDAEPQEKKNLIPQPTMTPTL